jgi:hypothetical protein
MIKDQIVNRKSLIYNILSYKIDKITDLIEYKKIYNFFCYLPKK